MSEHRDSRPRCDCSLPHFAVARNEPSPDHIEFYGRCDVAQLRDEAKVYADNLSEHGWAGAAARIVNLTEALIAARRAAA